MPEHYVQRGPATGGPPPNFVNLPEATAIYVDGSSGELVIGSGTSGVTGATVAPVKSLRTRVAIADVNAGLTLLPALVGKKYRLLDARVIAIGGAVTAATTVDILATQSTASVKLVSFAIAQLTQSTLLYPGITGATVLA